MIEPLTMLLVATALLVAGFLLAPRPKFGDPAAIQELESPTSEAGKPMGVVFGDVWIKDPNILWTGDKATVRRMVKA